MDAPIPVTIVTGFLGAGKTTFINELLRDPAFAETAVLINEFGDVQIDHDLVADFSDELVITTTGCMCCTASSDINQSLSDLSDKRARGTIGRFRRVIVETTGLLNPVPVIVALLASPRANPTNDAGSAKYSLARVVTLFDIVNGASTLDRHEEALKQIALSDVLLLTKTDLAHDPASRRDVKTDRKRLAAINPGAVILDRQTDWPEMRTRLLASNTYDLRGKGEDANAWLNAELDQTDPAHGHDHSHDHDHDLVDRTRHGDDIRSHVITLNTPVSPVVFSLFLDVLRMFTGTDLLRLKGIVGLSDDPGRPLVVHGVQHLIHPVERLDKWPSDDRNSKIVVIGRNIDVGSLRTILEA